MGKIALGTNNKIGDSIKEEFIKCEEIVNNILNKTLSLPDYANSENQKALTKQVSSVIFNNGDTTDIIQHHQDNYRINFGTTPSHYRKTLVNKGFRVK